MLNLNILVDVNSLHVQPNQSTSLLAGHMYNFYDMKHMYIYSYLCTHTSIYTSMQQLALKIHNLYLRWQPAETLSIPVHGCTTALVMASLRLHNTNTSLSDPA